MLAFLNCVAATRAVHASAPPEAGVALEEFILKDQALWQQRRQGQLSAEDWDMQYKRLIESEAERLQPMLPGILEELHERLRFRSESDQRLEQLLRLKLPSGKEADEIQSLLRDKSRETYLPICGMALLVGYLGRVAPGEAVDVLLTSGPPAESSQDACFIHALMSVGPTGYEAILKKISTKADRTCAYLGVMALVAQTTNTDFPVKAGLGRQEPWDKSFPKSSRGLRRLSEDWEKWWNVNGNKYDWNPDTSLLELR